MTNGLLLFDTQKLKINSVKIKWLSTFYDYKITDFVVEAVYRLI